MKGVIFSLFMVAVVGFSIFNNVEGAEFNVEEYYPLEVGDEWTYIIIQNGKDYIGTFKVEAKEKVENIDTFKVFDGDETYFYMGSSKEGIKVYKEEDIDGHTYLIYDAPFVELPAFTEIGEIIFKECSWKDRTKEGAIKEGGREGAIIESGREETKYVLEAKEEIKVEAGNFSDCLKVSYSGYWEEPDGDFGSYTMDRWYAPGVGMVRSLQSGSEYEAENYEFVGYTEEMRLKSAVIGGKQIGEVE